MQRKLVLLAGAAAVLGALFWLWHLSANQPQVAFLSRHAPAEWLVYPKPTVPHLQAVAELPTIFRRTFRLTEAPGSATLSVRACRRCIISINGKELVPVAPRGNWKEPCVLEVGGDLRAGENSISVTVFNSLGPPALWLSLAAPGLNLNSDASWQASYAGAVWRPAQLARQPAPTGEGNPLGGGEKVFASLRGRWQFLTGALLLSLGTLCGGWWWFKQNARAPLPSRWQWTRDPAVVALAGIAALWLCLFLHNLSLVPRGAGFDAEGHLEYIRYIQTRAALPLANEGWEMHQPPLYYLLGAAVLNCLKLSASSLEGVAVLRLISLTVGLMQLVVVFASLRLLFPGAMVPQLAGLALAGFLPMHLYLTHYVTNETLAACLMSASLYLALKLVRNPQPVVAGFQPASEGGIPAPRPPGPESSAAVKGCATQPGWRSFLLPGLCLGLALLTKVTALVLAPFILAAVLYRSVKSKDALPQPWLGPLLGVLACLAVCGWHFWKVWRHFGHPFFVPTRYACGVTWWQDPGYRTVAYFGRFGRSFTEPFFSSLSSFGDGLYATLWGDGLCGGAAGLLYRPPWNYDLMAAGFLLALIPAALALSGLVVVLWSAFRKPDPAWLGLLGFSFAMALAIVHLNLEVPAYAQAKAFFGLAALVPLCAFAARGAECLAQILGRFRIAVGVLFAVWAVTSYASFWVRADSAATRIALGRALMKERNFTAALTQLQSAVQQDPQDCGARSFLLAALLARDRVPEAAELARQTINAWPNDALGHLDLASVLEKQGRLPEALEETRRAVELAPEHPDARLQLASRLFKLKRQPETISASREALRLTPADPEVHFYLACALMAQAGSPQASLAFSGGETLLGAPTNSLSPGEILTAEALNHFYFVLRLAPDTAEALNRLAWIRATHPRSEFRNGREAAGLAERACALAAPPDPALLITLAAAHAETGQYTLAVETAEKAEKLAAASGKDALRAMSRHLADLFLTRQPWRQNLPANRPDEGVNK